MDSTLEESATAAAAATATASADDLSAIAWVQEELRRSLDAAHKSLRRFIKDSEAVTGSDLDTVDPGVLRTARAQIHQGVGALELVGLPAPAIVLRASETAVQKSIGRPQSLTPELVADIERSSFALLDYLSRVLAGKNVSPLSLFPQYRAVQEAVEAERVHPADLWAMDWRWREVQSDADVLPRQADATVRSQLEGSLLQLMRGTQALTAASRMSDVCAGLAAGSSHPQVRTFWNLAAAVFERSTTGCSASTSSPSVSRRRLLAQFRILQRGDSDVSERLARDPAVLRVAERAGRPRHPRAASRGRARRVRPARAGADRLFAERARPLRSGRHHACQEARHRRQGSVVGDGRRRDASHRRPDRAVRAGRRFAAQAVPFGETFAAELQTAVTQTQTANAAPPPRWRWRSRPACSTSRPPSKTATSMMPEHAGRVRRLADRLSAVRQEAPPEPLEPWMEELYRRVSDRQTMGSVVQELRASLGEAEKAIDNFFRNPAEPGVLVDVPTQLASMRGVLSVLGMDQASQALLRMRDEVHGAGIDRGRSCARDAGRRVPAPGRNLSALGFMIDMLSVQPQLAKSLFVSDAEAGTLAPVMGRSSGVPEQAAPVEPRLIEAGADARLQLGARRRALARGHARPRTTVARSAGRRPAGARRRGAEGAGGVAQGCRRSRQGDHGARRALRSARRFRRDVDGARRHGAGVRGARAGADEADRADRRSRARRGNARGLPRGSRRSHHGCQGSDWRAAAFAQRSRSADDHPAPPSIRSRAARAWSA